ncbi:MAG: Arm DNA-binding domain-containing protein [Pseudomonadota bacterium]|nr:Arm DNA-binding domain-containing protein [Pseudomonadota bacterium]
MTEWTNEEIASLHLKSDKRNQYKVGGACGAKNLYIAVSPSGGKQWFFRKQVDGKSKSTPLGPFPEVSLERAVEKARQLSLKYWEENNDTL